MTPDRNFPEAVGGWGDLIMLPSLYRKLLDACFSSFHLSQTEKTRQFKERKKNLGKVRQV
jgi:hypothetical protein